jgi:mRNA-degrading endonuclease toxin of MazEF toxin-antitoxin module
VQPSPTACVPFLPARAADKWHARRFTPAVNVQRGSVWWGDLDPARGSEIRKSRPAVVLSGDGLNRARRAIVVVPLSTGAERHPPIVVATPSAGDSSVAV